MPRTATVEIYKDEISFSAGHFTIFSATQREDLHGHNYNVGVALETVLNENGLSFDYRIYKNKLIEFANTLHLKFLLPAHSQFLKIEDQGDMWFAYFNNERIPFLKRDALILPLTNITIEELSHWFLQKLLENPDQLKQHEIQSIEIKVFNGPGQSGLARHEVN
jgi:6-pyruvoyltetrahydropterin/6-carboxytetrahydropterin synthase